MAAQTNNDKGTFILRCSFFAQVKILTREQYMQNLPGLRWKLNEFYKAKRY